MGADETRPAGDEDFHGYLSPSAFSVGMHRRRTSRR
jgi:hypothetical protein